MSPHALCIPPFQYVRRWEYILENAARLYIIMLYVFTKEICAKTTYWISATSPKCGTLFIYVYSFVVLVFEFTYMIYF